MCAAGQSGPDGPATFVSNQELLSRRIDVFNHSEKLLYSMRTPFAGIVTVSFANRFGVRVTRRCAKNPGLKKAVPTDNEVGGISNRQTPLWPLRLVW
jgi:hypothetical protein